VVARGGDTCHSFLVFPGDYVDQYKIDTWHCTDMTRGTARTVTWPNDRPTCGSTDDRCLYGC
jgi:hypothetical protein